MSYDDSATTYHLTHDGWKVGEPPPDRIETWSRSVSQASGWSKEYVAWTCLWTDPALERAERDKVRAKHSDVMGRPGRSGDRITQIGQPL